jgi:hypothetical protein
MIQLLLSNLCVTDSPHRSAVCLSVTFWRLETSAHCGSRRSIFLSRFDLPALYPNSGSASTLERVSYKHNGNLARRLGRWTRLWVPRPRLSAPRLEDKDRDTAFNRRHHASRYRDSKTESPDNASGDRYLGSRYRDLKTETWTKLWLPLFRVSASGREDGAPGLGFMAPGLRSSAREKDRRPAALGRGPRARRRDPGTANRRPPAKGRGPGMAVGVAGLGVSGPRLGVAGPGLESAAPGRRS